MKGVKFLEGSIEREFNEEGYTLIENFLDLYEVEELRKIYYKYHIERVEGLMWNSLYYVSVEDSIRISNQVLEIVQPKLDKIFEAYNAPLATIMSKTGLKPEGLDTPHRDYSVLDEEKFEYRQIWIPIVDITEQNGPMFVIPKSHKLPHRILPMMGTCVYREKESELKRKYTDPILMKSGDLLVYADRTIHAGYPNYTTHERPVVHFGLVPPEATVRYYERDRENANTINVFEVENDWYLKVRDFTNAPKEGRKFLYSFSEKELDLSEAVA